MTETRLDQPRPERLVQQLCWWAGAIAATFGGVFLLPYLGEWADERPTGAHPALAP